MIRNGTVFWGPNCVSKRSICDNIENDFEVSKWIDSQNIDISNKYKVFSSLKVLCLLYIVS